MSLLRGEVRAFSVLFGIFSNLGKMNENSKKFRKAAVIASTGMNVFYRISMKNMRQKLSDVSTKMAQDLFLHSTSKTSWSP